MVLLMSEFVFHQHCPCTNIRIYDYWRVMRTGFTVDFTLCHASKIDCYFKIFGADVVPISYIFRNLGFTNARMPRAKL